MVIDIEDARRQKAVRAAENGDTGPARRAQENLLSRLIGCGEGVLDFHVINPKDPLKGLWDSLEKATVAKGRRTPVTMPWISGRTGKIAHTEDAGEPYTVIARSRSIRVDSGLDHLQGAYINFIPFRNMGREYLKIFGGVFDTTTQQDTVRDSLLYLRTADGTWKRQDHPERSEDAWAHVSSRLGFLQGVAVHNVHRDRIAIEHFDFIPDPKRILPKPPVREHKSA